MATALDPVLLAVIATCQSAPALGALVGVRIYDTIAPQGAPFPYITITSPTESAFDTFARFGNVNSLTLHIWTRDVGLDQTEVSSRLAHAIYRALDSLLNLTSLPVSGPTFVRGRLVYIVGTLDPDGITYHGVARYDTITRS